MSVIIPTFHREHEVIEATRSALDQREVEVEVIVLDDSAEGSARGAIEAIGDARVRYVKRAVPSGGAPALARNEGMALARGRFLVFLDDDDRLDDGALAALAAAIEHPPGAGAAIGVVRPFGAGAIGVEEAYFARAAARLRACRSRRALLACLLFKEAPIINSACMIRRDLARSLGGYDAHVLHCEDADLYLRAARRSGAVFVDRTVVHYRVSGESRIHRGGLEGEMNAAYRRIHEKYRQEHGSLKFLALKLLARLYP
ncbi:MAG: glycosyltransferase [Byssovorax sp.]